jgi:hypothetical protein
MVARWQNVNFKKSHGPKSKFQQHIQIFQRQQKEGEGYHAYSLLFHSMSQFFPTDHKALYCHLRKDSVTHKSKPSNENDSSSIHRIYCQKKGRISKLHNKGLNVSREFSSAIENILLWQGIRSSVQLHRTEERTCCRKTLQHVKRTPYHTFQILTHA